MLKMVKWPPTRPVIKGFEIRVERLHDAKVFHIEMVNMCLKLPWFLLIITNIKVVVRLVSEYYILQSG